MPFDWPSASDRIHRCRLALLVFVVALSLPDVAAAGCGSHVTYSGDEKKLPLPAPCQGPNCSQAPDAPPFVPSTAPQTTADDSALSSVFAFVPESGTWFGPMLPESHAVYHVDPPDPPPRDRDHL